jgi:diaminopropionate ammonia-lyase
MHRIRWRADTLLSELESALRVNEAIKNKNFDRARFMLPEYIGVEAAERARALIEACPAYQITPFHDLDGAAESSGVRSISYKDEGPRLGLKSFKALGGTYAVAKLISRLVADALGKEVSISDVFDGVWGQQASLYTITSATDGNHGRAVAAGVRLAGAKCIIYMPGDVSPGREAIIQSFGARVRRVDGSYDDAVRAVATDSAENGWYVVSDTGYDGYEDIPRDVMHGYGVIVSELADQLTHVPTHVFLQGGVGAFAGVIAAWLLDKYKDACPTIIIVEPERADCFLKSGAEGRPVIVGGRHETLMGGLACGEISTLAWPIIKHLAGGFISIPDDAIAPAMRALASGRLGARIEAGETGVSGLIGAMTTARDPVARELFGINQGSRFLVIGTEGATDPEMYRALIEGHHHT